MRKASGLAVFFCTLPVCATDLNRPLQHSLAANLLATPSSDTLLLTVSKLYAQGMAHGETEVLSCLINNYDTVDEGCQREVSRAVRMALWNYQPQLALTGNHL